MNQQIVPGSIKAASKSGDVALALLDAKLVLLCDRSSSMSEEARGRKARFQLEDEIVTAMQTKHPGQVALIAFADTAYLCLDGILPAPYGMTNMLDAFRVAEPLCAAGLRCVLITDGEPSHAETEVLEAARAFKGKLDGVYVGPEGFPGQSFLAQIVAVAGGTSEVADLEKNPALLEQSLTRLLLQAGGR